MNQIFEFFNKLNNAQKTVIISGVAIMLIFLSFIVIYSQNNEQNIDHNYIIAKNLTKNEMMNVTNELESIGIPFSIVGASNNMALKTSKDFINIAKIKLVSSGALKSNHQGWEIFDASSIGETSFQNKIKFVRAIEGELARSLEALSYVQKAAVKVVLPKESIFSDKKTNATAAVVLTLEIGRYLSNKQIKGVKNFIASAVLDLKPQFVQLINQNGELLEDVNGGVDEDKYKSQITYKSKLQKKLEENIVQLLEPIIGNIVAKVNVELDYTQRDIVEETFNPEGSIRSEQIDEKITNESNSTASKSAESNDLSSKAGGSGKKNNEHIVKTINYEVGKKITNISNSAYAIIKRITAAVTFDELVLKDIENPQAYIVNIEDIVKDSIGFDPERNDKITVKSFKFAIKDNPDDIEAAPSIPLIKHYLNEFGPYLKYIIVALLLLFIYKKFVNFKPEDLTQATKVANLADVATGGGAQVNADNNLFEKSEKDDRNEKLKNKISNQLSALEGLDEESKVKIDTLISELSTSIDDDPISIANMIELLLDEEV
jgi:flagellar M-ring protein FliF